MNSLNGQMLFIDNGVYPHLYYNEQIQQQQQYLQQMELMRIRQVQQQAAFQQQRALLHQQQMMYYEQQQVFDQNDIYAYPVTDISYIRGDASLSSSSPPPSSVGGKAQKRAEHNAIERARRESLNTKFQQLAHSLPNLQNDRRPSKGTIIERTLEYVKQTVQKEERFQTEIEKLRQANESLISKMTDNTIMEEDDYIINDEDEYDEEDDDVDETATPECEDNFSSRSSVTSSSSSHVYYPHLQHQHHQEIFQKFQQQQRQQQQQQQQHQQQEPSSSLLLNKGIYCTIVIQMIL
ncbi:unnamed protein product [Mucor hiemalis]